MQGKKKGENVDKCCSLTFQCACSAFMIEKQGNPV